MHASTAPPQNSPSTKYWGKVLHEVCAASAARYLFPMLSFAYWKLSMSTRWYGRPRASKKPKMVQQNSQFWREKIIILCFAFISSTNAVASSVTPGRGTPGGASPGVESAIVFSSSVMSAGTSAKRGVLRYLSPVSGSIARIRDPFGAWLRANSSAEASVPPPLTPENIPSLCASSFEVAMAASEPVKTISSMRFERTASSTMRGIQSGVHPWSRCGRQMGWGSLNRPSLRYSVFTPEYRRGALSGSQTMILVSGDSLRSTVPTPFSVPPVPYPVKK
mmetsp:Transcript_18234/g.34524  ORF Transcript_18234/g.34524 Transcript_18234/m.34524 type:complete len:277 (-) Transcript_18234:281-1111(-)